jgi:RNA polymerase sigma-70 factor, ECF subfamily
MTRGVGHEQTRESMRNVVHARNCGRSPAAVNHSPMHALDFDRFRPALTGLCYRMLGSLTDAEDAVQETMLRAWKARDSFDGRAQLSTWLHRIATNVCLDALSGRSPRWRPFDVRPVGTTREELVTKPAEHWVEPIPDLAVIPSDVDVHEQAVLRESIRLAFVAALQHLPPRQRAALILTQVLNWSAAEVAESLDMTVAAVNSALQRARGTLAERRATAHLDRLVALGTHDRTAEASALSASQRRLVDEFVAAFEDYDVPRLTALLREDATMCMPPFDLWLQGRADIADWLTGRGCGCQGSRLVRTQANGMPAFAQYRQGGEQPWALVVLDLDGDRIGSMTYFLDTATFFPRFGVPPMISPEAADRRQGPRATA